MFILVLLMHIFWDSLCRISKAKFTEYSEKIEALAAKLATPMADVQVAQDPITGTFASEDPSKTDGESSHHSSGLRRRSVPPLNAKEGTQGILETDQTVPVKLDATAQTHIVKHRKLQEDLTDEMVVLARQLKESTLTMSQSIQNTKKVLDSTEKAVEHSLASTGHASTRAVEVYNLSSKTTCFTWLAIFVMTCIFIMVVLLIRVT